MLTLLEIKLDKLKELNNLKASLESKEKEKSEELNEPQIKPNVEELEQKFKNLELESEKKLLAEKKKNETLHQSLINLQNDNKPFIKPKPTFLDSRFTSKFHNHTLYESTKAETDWCCDVCKENYLRRTKLRYRCEQCDFDICGDCKYKETKAKPNQLNNLSKKHQHSLKLNKRIISKICSLCKKNSHIFYSCTECNGYFVCENCKRNGLYRLNLTSFGDKNA